MPSIPIATLSSLLSLVIPSLSNTGDPPHDKHVSSPPVTNFLQSIGQMTSTANIASNLAQAQLLIRKAVAAKASALFLPEAADYIGSSPEESLSLVRSVQDSEFVQGVRKSAKEAKLCVSVGVHEPVEGGKKTKNCLLWIDAEGEITQRYQKLHLFDIDIKGGTTMKEST